MKGFICLTSVFVEFHRSNWWLPLKWSIEVITAAREGELISNPPGPSAFPLQLFGKGLYKYLHNSAFRIQISCELVTNIIL